MTIPAIISPSETSNRNKNDGNLHRKHLFAVCTVPCLISGRNNGRKSVTCTDEEQANATQSDSNANGLPLAGATVRCLASGRSLCKVRHKFLASYVDVHTAANGWILLISEHHNKTLLDILNGVRFADVQPLCDITKFSIVRQVVEALRYLHCERKIVCGRLALDQFLVVDKNPMHIKITGYGLMRATEYGANIDFTIPNPHTMAPEVFCSGGTDSFTSNGACSYKSDVWSLGMCIFYLLTGCVGGWKPRQFLSLMASIIHSGSESAFDQLLTACKLVLNAENQPHIAVESLPDVLVQIVRKCLFVDPLKRPTISEISEILQNSDVSNENLHDSALFSDDLDMVFDGKTDNVLMHTNMTELKARVSGAFNRARKTESFHPVLLRPIEEIYALWKLTGSAIEVILKRKGVINDPPFITVIPRYQPV